ncbi:MAG: TonB family protein [Deltaproteobacteria bacterium]|nr:TonB family protein [Deltaproteobacteria bacterium]MBI2211122.1 TonB family protein [Deltaproteobacteria bacterium]MBI2538694.1 TonB family protein [Deltaproteobacteria bacterium]MBI2990820.1 TonB family protein [Deltaproteobacteria bacterium]
MAQEATEGWAELALYSLVRKPFLPLSLALHVAIFYLFGALVLAVNPDESIKSIPVKLIELGQGRSPDKSIGPDRGPGGPRALPRLGFPEIARQQSGKLDSGSVENLTPSKESVPAAADSAPALPRPKLLADLGRPRPFAVKESAPDSLVRLPTKDSVTGPAPAANQNLNQRSLAALKGKGDGEGIRALNEGAQIPGALKGTGTGTGPYGVPGGIREGSGIRGGGTGSGSGGGSSSGLKGALSADYNQYLKLIEKRVFSVWKYPDGVTGVQKVSVRFTLDKAGKLSQVEVLDSTDPRINGSALEAMKKASPFPPIPESLRDLAGESLIIRFTVDIRLRG